MLNNGFYFVRIFDEGDRLHNNTKREYPREVYPFGSEEIELFACEAEYWKAIEKKTGILVAREIDMDSVVKEAFRVIDEYGKDNFSKLVYEVLEKINQGLEYDYKIKLWIDPKKRNVEPEIPDGADE